MNKKRLGYCLVVSSYIIFGLLPLYWKCLKDIQPEVLLIHRVLWSVLSLSLLLFIKGSLKNALSYFRIRSVLIPLFASALLLCVNWFTYLWAIAHGQVLGASMGYFISPVLTVLLGAAFLGEKLSSKTAMALSFAAIGILLRACMLGSVPWVALVLCISFSLYSLLHKQSKAPALEGLFVEMTLMLLPILALYYYSDVPQLWGSSTRQNTGLALSGIITVVPLALLIAGTKYVPMQFIGLSQYIIPSLYFALAVFAFGETVFHAELYAFFFIWLGLLVFWTPEPKQKLEIQAEVIASRS